MEFATSVKEIQSDAWNKNMRLTNVPVVVEPVFTVLEEAVRGYAGKERQAGELLVEYHHRYRNWRFVVQEAWRYATANFRLYTVHPHNGRIVALLSRIFLEALESSEQADVRSRAADCLLAFWLKIVEEAPGLFAAAAPEDFAFDRVLDEPVRLETCHRGIPRALFATASALPHRAFECLTRSYYQPKKLGQALLGLWTEAEDFGEFRSLMNRVLRETHALWLRREDPLEWILKQMDGAPVSAAIQDVFASLTHAAHRRQLEILDRLARETDHRKAVAQMLAIPDFRDVVLAFHHLPDQLKGLELGKNSEHLSMLARLKIIETKGLESIHEETLREINFDLVRWMRNESIESLQDRLERVYDALAGCLLNYPEAALQCIRTIGLEILDSQHGPVIDAFVKRIIAMGFQTPELGGVSRHWQVQVNPAHIANVRIWLELIKRNPKKTRTLLSALIVNLSLGGICIRDTDLFQKDVSRLLHAPIQPIYNLVKQLSKLFPVYFNEIGAEGQLRAVSTDVDELTGRGDQLIHFLRKQSHVESNNLIVLFMEAILNFWLTLDKEPLARFVPEEVIRQVSTSGPYVDEIHRIFQHLFSKKTINRVKDLLDVPEAHVEEMIAEVPDISDRERRRAALMIRFYQLLHEKYALSFKDIQVHLKRAVQLGLPDPAPLMKTLEAEDPLPKLEAILDYLLALKEIILMPSDMHIVENIYHKRHIAVDIPSMYGSYNERKFDALGLTFRLENLANLLFEEIIFSFNLSFITRATFFRIARVLPLFIKALDIDGITSRRLERQEDLFQRALEIRRFSHSQYMDIFRGFSEAIKQIIQTNYNAVHADNLQRVVEQLSRRERFIPRYRREGRGESFSIRVQRISESFLRDLVARTFGLQYFDHFITSILTTLATQKEELNADSLDLLLSYDPEKTISWLHSPDTRTYDLIHLGNKGYNLVQLHSIDIRVPPGFVITTEYFRCREVIEAFPQSREDFEERVMASIRGLEHATGRNFGSPGNALLLSVRSGSVVSMPGMMNTFLNVGINERIVDGLIQQTGEAWFAWDNYRRFLQSWGMSFGLERDEFDAVMNFYKNRYGRKVKRDFSPEEIRELARAYRKTLQAHAIDFSDDPREQLFTAIRQVVESWYIPKAQTYREIMGLSEKWGTAVTVQTMVFGNLDTRSGAGVMFTHNPWTSEEDIDPTGDFTLGNQGEDVVGGLVKTLPLSEKQRMTEGERKEHSLESLFPRVYQRLVDIARELIYRQNWGPQEIEFTFQGDHQDGVHVLQCRNMAPRIPKLYPVFQPTKTLHEGYLGSGIGVSGGAVCGRVAFDLESIVRLRKEHPREPIILIRSDTVPDDIHEISIADAILTGKGGATSHAAIVAHRLGKTCVVGCSRLRVWQTEGRCAIDGRLLRTGDIIGIDGRSGAIYYGTHAIQRVEVPG